MNATADQQNVGYVIADNGGEKVRVRFTDPETGSVATLWIDRKFLLAVKGSGTAGPTAEGKPSGHEGGDQ